MASQNRGGKVPPTMYVGMFAGTTKPKPFQRKSPNLSLLAPSKLPPLHDMRTLALQLHKGSYRPCPTGESRRMELATQHIYEGIIYISKKYITNSDNFLSFFKHKFNINK